MCAATSGALRQDGCGSASTCDVPLRLKGGGLPQGRRSRSICGDAAVLHCRHVRRTLDGLPCGRS